MNFKQEKVADNKIKLTITVEPGKLKLAEEQVYQKLAPEVKVSGFRPGKAPKNLVEKEIGQDRFNAEVLDMVIPESYYQVVTENKIEAVGAPEIRVTKYVPKETLEYEATVDLIPEVKVPSLSKIKVKRNSIKISDDEIKDTLTDLAKQLSKPKSVTRAAKKGDRVDINFEGFIDNIPFEGGKSDNYPLQLGSGQFIPGFEEQLEGMKINEEKDVKITFPKEYHAENLAGKEAVFKVKMNGIEELIMPEMTDEFAKLVGPFETLEALKEDIKKELVRTKELQERKRVEDAVLEEMLKEIKFTAPSSLVHQEIHRLIHEAEQNLAYSGMNLEKYFEMTKTNMDQLEEQLKPEAEKRVKIGLVLTELAKEKKFEVSKDEINETIKKRTEYLPEDQKKTTEDYYNSHEGQHQIENMIIGQKVMDYLYETCSK